MKKLLFLILTLTVFFILSCKNKKVEIKSENLNSFARIQERGSLILGLDNFFPPMGFKDKSNEIVGFDIDLAKAVCGKLGLELICKPINWNSKEAELYSGNIDCIWNGFSKTKERESVFLFTKPYLDNAQVLVVREEDNITKLSDISNKTIGVQSGSSAQKAIENNDSFKRNLKAIIEFNDNITALNVLETGGIDGVVLDLIFAEYIIKQEKMSLFVVPEGLTNEEYAIGFRKEDIELKNAVQNILEELAADGTCSAISKKWFGKDIIAKDLLN